MNKIERTYKLLSLVLVISIATDALHAQTSLTHGYQVFLRKGLMLDAVNFPSIYNTLNPINWEASNFTCSNTARNSIPPNNGSDWGYWLKEDYSNKVTPISGTPSDALLHVQYGDEQSISSGLTGYAEVISELKAFYPNQLVYMNQGIGSSGYQVSTFPLSTLMNFTQTVKPDILNFTEYPFRWLGTGYVHDYDGGSPTTMYVHMEMYRKAGLAGLTGDGSQPIPVGMYVQQYAQLNSSSVNDDEPSQSQMNLQAFAAWAFGFRKTSCFVYDSTSSLDSALFETNTDDVPSTKFYQVAEMNRQSLNLSDAIVRLISADVRIKMGQNKDSGPVVNNDLPSGITAFGESGSVDPYMKNVIATNLGSYNNGLAGDVIIGYLNPLNASLVEIGAENDLYFMIVNGLTDAIGDAEACQQNIHIEFDFSDTAITRLLRLSRDTGEVEVVNLVDEGNGIYSLDFILGGGVGDLFKYDTGTAFVPEPATLSIIMIGCLLFRRKNKHD